LARSKPGFGVREGTFSQREKVVAKRPAEGLRRSKGKRRRRIPAPVAFGDTLSLWERIAA
jgi:hypothetical protein